MPTTRRDFVIGASAGIATLAAGGITSALAQPLAQEARNNMNKRRVLFLGGTGMLGPHVIEELQNAGHEITLFNRGTRADMFPDLEQITGNRVVDIEPGLEPLQQQVDAGRKWDIVIDTANVHTWVENTAKILKDAAERYAFVSSMSVYADSATRNADESTEVETMPDEVADAITTLPYDMRYFGAVKARCEAAAERHFPGRALVYRPGLLVGPRDFSHRFTYWPYRVRNGGEVLAPGAPDHAVQFIDVRDLAAFMTRLAANDTAGTFNVNGPIEGSRTIGQTLNACKDVTNSDATFTWADSDWLAANGVAMWGHMPVWIPPTDELAGFHTRNIDKAKRAGLTARPLSDTIKDTLDWFDNNYLPGFREAMAERGTPDQEFSFGGGRRPGLDKEREAALLKSWHEHLRAGRDDQ